MIPKGGHVPPISIAGDKLEWKNAQLEIEQVSRLYPLKEPYVHLAMHTAHQNKTVDCIVLRHMSRAGTFILSAYSYMVISSLNKLID